jgi:hypothetical protein
MYTVPKLWQHKRVIAQCARCQSYGHTKEWSHNVHGAKAMVTQKSDRTMYTVPKLWPHKRVIAQCTWCQSYCHTKTYFVKCGGPHSTESRKRPKAIPPACFLCNGRHPANCKGCMLYRDLASARNRNNSLYKRRSNVRTTFNWTTTTNQQ